MGSFHSLGPGDLILLFVTILWIAAMARTFPRDKSSRNLYRDNLIIWGMIWTGLTATFCLIVSKLMR